MNEKTRELVARAVEAGDFRPNGDGIFLPGSGLIVGGVFSVEHYRAGRLLSRSYEPNLITDVGLNYLLDVALSNGAASASWFVGIFANNYTPLAADTSAILTSSYGQLTTQYDEATRPAWTEAGASSQQITNSASKAVFTFNTSANVYGAFLIDASTKTGATGTLFAASKFSVSRAVVDTDELNVTYTIQAATA